MPIAIDLLWHTNESLETKHDPFSFLPIKAEAQQSSPKLQAWQVWMLFSPYSSLLHSKHEPSYWDAPKEHSITQL